MADTSTGQAPGGSNSSLGTAQMYARAVERSINELASLKGRHRENLFLAKHGSQRVQTLKGGLAYAERMSGLYAQHAKNYEYTASISSAQSTRARVISGAHGVVACGKLAEVLLVASKFTGAAKALSEKAKASAETLEQIKTAFDIGKEAREAATAITSGSIKDTASKSGTTALKFFDLTRDLADIVDTLMAWVGLVAPPKGQESVSASELVAMFAKTLKSLFLLVKATKFYSHHKKHGVAGQGLDKSWAKYGKTSSAKQLTQATDVFGALANIVEAIIACYSAYEEYEKAAAYAHSEQSDLGFASRMWGGALSQVEVSVLRACLEKKEYEIRFEYFQRLTRNRGTSRELALHLKKELDVLLPRLRKANSELTFYASRLGIVMGRLSAEVQGLQFALGRTQDAWMVADKKTRDQIKGAQVELEETLARGYAALQ